MVLFGQRTFHLESIVSSVVFTGATLIRRKLIFNRAERVFADTVKKDERYVR